MADQCKICDQADERSAMVQWSDAGLAHARCIREVMAQARPVAEAMQAHARKRK